MHIADNIKDSSVQACINGKWVVARPISYFGLQRIKDAWAVLTGKADAVRFIGQ